MFLEMRGGTLSFTFFCGLLHSTHMRQDTGPQVLVKGETEERHSTNMPQTVCIAIGKDYMMDKGEKKKKKGTAQTCQTVCIATGKEYMMNKGKKKKKIFPKDALPKVWLIDPEQLKKSSSKRGLLEKA